MGTNLCSAGLTADDQWRVVAAAVRGAGHARAETPCQDRHCWRTLPGGAVVAAVADGAGSAERAERGAEVAARVAVEAAAGLCDPLATPEEESTWKQMVLAAVGAARSAVEAEAAALSAQPHDLATTLIVVVATQNVAVAAQVGDGGAVWCDRESNLGALTLPSNGEYPNETTFLVSPEALQSVQLGIYRGPLRGIALFTDGLQRLALQSAGPGQRRQPGATHDEGQTANGGSSAHEGSALVGAPDLQGPTYLPYAPFFDPLFRFAAAARDTRASSEQLAAFLSSPRVRARTDDDVTLLLGHAPW